MATLLIQQGIGLDGDHFAAVGQLSEPDGSPAGQSLMLRKDREIKCIPVPGYAIGIARDERTGRIVIVAQDGEAAELIDGTLVTKPINGPETFGILRSVRCIDGHFIACGMARQVYLLVGDQWTGIDHGLRKLPPDPLEVYGFNAVDGPSIKDMWAVGFGIGFRHRDKFWDQLDLPTNLVLSDIVWIGGDQWCAVGQRGVIILGNGEQARALEHQWQKADLISIEYFGGAIYVASSLQLFRVTNDAIEPVKLVLPSSAAITSLCATADRLWAFGLNLFTYTFDGVTWHVPELTGTAG
jgi:hypothetical protein